MIAPFILYALLQLVVVGRLNLLTRRLPRHRELSVISPPVLQAHVQILDRLGRALCIADQHADGPFVVAVVAHLLCHDMPTRGGEFLRVAASSRSIEFLHDLHEAAARAMARLAPDTLSSRRPSHRFAVRRVGDGVSAWSIKTHGVT